MGGRGLGSFHRAEDCTDNQHLGGAADLFADMFPAPAFLALDIEQLFGEVGSIHRSVPVDLVVTRQNAFCLVPLTKPKQKPRQTGERSSPGGALLSEVAIEKA